MPGFRNVLVAEAVSNFGSMLSRLALPWLAAIALQVSPLQMAMLLVADVLAGAVGGVLLGVVVDRASKRRVMVAADLARAAIFALLALLGAQARLSFWMLVAAAAATGLLTMAFETARAAWVAVHVDAATLPHRNAQLSAAGSASETIAFALGGWLYQGLGAIAALAIDAASFVVSALCLRRVAERPAGASGPRSDERSPERAGEPIVGSSWRALRDETGRGLRAIAGAPTLRALAVVDALLALGGGIAGASYMIFVTRDLGFATGPLGVIFALGGIGALAGAALAPRLGRRLGAGASVATGLALVTVGAICIPLAPGATAVGAMLLVAQQLVGDGGHVVQDVHTRTFKQTLVPAALVGRVDGGLRTIGQAATVLGAVAGGAFATRFGTRAALAASAACFALAALWAAWRLAAPAKSRARRREA